MKFVLIDLPDLFFREQYRFMLEVKAPMLLPEYKGSTFRGGLSQAFKRMVCAMPKNECFACILAGECLYSKIFDSTPKKHYGSRSRFDKAPRPYVINPPKTEKRFFEPGDALEFDLVLIGPACKSLPYMINACCEMGRTGLGARPRGRKQRGELAVLNVWQENGESPKKVYDGEMDVYTPPERRVALQAPAPEISGNQVGIRFGVPLRIQENGHLVTKLSFESLFTSLSRRLGLLGEFYGNSGALPDFAPLLEAAAQVKTVHDGLRWRDWERYSGRQKTRMRFGGLVGTIVFEGDLEPFMPFLALGACVNTGQLTTFGLGKYQFINLN